MAEDGLNNSQSVLASVFGYVSREIQEFVVTAVTGAPSTSSAANAGPSVPPATSSKHKRSRSVARSISDFRSVAEPKRRRRPSSPHPHALPDHYPPEDHSPEPRGSRDDERSASIDSTRPSPSGRNIASGSRPKTPKSSKRGDMGPPKLPSPRGHPTMPGSFSARSPTPAEFRQTVPARPPPGRQPRSTGRPSPESQSRGTSRGRGRSTSRVRFAPRVLQRQRSATPEEVEAEEVIAPPPPPTVVPAVEPEHIKVEDDDDEIIILPGPPSPPVNRGRKAAAPRRIERSPEAPRQASSSHGASGSAASSSTNHLPAPVPIADGDMSISELMGDPKGKGKAKEVYREPEANNGDRGGAGQDETERERIRRLEAEVQRLRAELASRSDSAAMPPPAPPPPPPPPPPGYIAIPATSWANGLKHPSQRSPVVLKRKPRKSLQPTIPTESMEAFLSELKTVKLRNTGVIGPANSPATLRRSANNSLQSVASSNMAAGLMALRAGLKRKRMPDGDDDHDNALQDAVRRRYDATSPTHETYENHEENSYESNSSGANTSGSGVSENHLDDAAEWRDEGRSISWTQPGPFRPASRSVPPSPQRLDLSSRSLASSGRLAAPKAVPGLASSDMTTPSLCSDTEPDHESLERSVDVEEDVQTPQDEPVPVPELEDEAASALSKSYLRPIGLRGGFRFRDVAADLSISDLRTSVKGKEPAKVQPEPITQQPTPPPAPPPASSQLRRSTHAPPARSPVDIFSARPPKSPLPAEARVPKPKPPARLSTSRRDSILPRDPPPPFKLYTASNHESTSGPKIPTKPRRSVPTTNQSDDILGLFDPLFEKPTESAPAPPPPQTSQTTQQPLRASQTTQSRKSKRRVDDSLSLDEEMRRVAAGQRIAELDLDFELGDITTGAHDDEDMFGSGVFVGTGQRSRRSGYTSGGGAGGVPITTDNGFLESPEPTAGDQSFRMKSRIPVPRGLHRSQ